MANSMDIHNVQGMNISRDDENRWTIVRIDHESWGIDAKGEHVKLQNCFEITLHHSGSGRLKIRTRKKS